MRIGIDGSCWANRRGFGRFTRGLVAAMTERDDGHQYVLLIDSVSRSARDFPNLPLGLDAVDVELDAAPSLAAGAASARSVHDLLRMTQAARRLSCDVFFFPASYSYYPIVGTPIVVTVHDAIADQRPDLTLPTRGDRVRWRLKQAAALKQAKAVLTVSRASRLALTEVLHVAPQRLHVIREAPAADFVPMSAEHRDPLLRRFGLTLDSRYLLYVGGISPHKNVGGLVEAFGTIAGEIPDVQLLLVGETDDDPFLSSTASVRAAITASPVAPRIQLTGYVSDAELVALYSGAIATALPSLGEGFGLTAAESAACGTPVVASTDPALVELLGDAGDYADVAVPGELAERLRRLLVDADYRATRGQAIRQRAAEWSWDAAAETTISVLTSVARVRG